MDQAGGTKLEEEMSSLLADPRFENLLAKAESHQWQFRPQESERLAASGELRPLLQSRTRECWDELKACRRAGMNMGEAQEVAFQKILVAAEPAKLRASRPRGTLGASAWTE